MTTKKTVNVGTCSISVQGMDFTCPLCLTLVKSGEEHKCEFRDGKFRPVKTVEGESA